MKLPRVLVVSGDPIGSSSGIGITLQNLFREFPADSVGQIFTSQAPADWSRSVMTARVSRSGVAFDKPGGDAGSAFHIKESGIQRHVRHALRVWSELIPFTIGDSLQAEIERFRPHIVYSPLGGARLCRLALDAAAVTGVPIVPHFMDDWPTTLYAEWYTLPQRRALERNLREVLSKSPFGLAISEEMALEYFHRFGLEFNFVPNSATAGSLNRPEPAPPIVLSYVGGMHLNRWKSLLEVSRVVDQVREEGNDVRFVLYAPEDDLETHGKKFTSATLRSIRPSEVGAVLTDSHVLLHVEAFDSHSRTYTRLSLSTKIAQYMAAARPILVYAPKEVASSKYVERAHAGIVCSSTDEVHAALLSLLSVCVRKKHGEAAGVHAQQFHDPERVGVAVAKLLGRAASL